MRPQLKVKTSYSHIRSENKQNCVIFLLKI